MTLTIKITYSIDGDLMESAEALFQHITDTMPSAILSPPGWNGEERIQEGDEWAIIIDQWETVEEVKAE